MALPVLNTPKFKLKLPSDNRVVNFRPFLVKEEKILLIATETGEQAELITAIKNIIKACTDIKDVEHLSTFDIEYVFLQIRTKSVGESVEVNVTCPDDGETQVPVSIPLDQIKIHKTKGHKKEIKLSEEIVLTMKMKVELIKSLKWQLGVSNLLQIQNRYMSVKTYQKRSLMHF